MSSTPPIYIGVLGLAYDGKGKFLLTQRNQPEDTEVHLKWQIAGGGMEYGETPEQTLAREMQEELSVSVRILSPQPIAKTSVWDLKDRSYHITLLTYVVSLDNQTPKIGDPETHAFKWMTPNEIATLDSLPLTREIVEEALVILENKF